MIAAWPCPDAADPTGGTLPEYALQLDSGRKLRLLIVPALFDEANRMRRLTVEVMRRLDLAGIDCLLPDLPGCNESLQSLSSVTLDNWSSAMVAACRHFGATHVLTVRGGALVAPQALPGWRYAPVGGAVILRHMLRMRILASREAGVEETQLGLLATGRQQGLNLAGYPLSAAMIASLEHAEPPASSQTIIGQDLIGGSPLWLRAEPDEDRAQADALAAIVAVGMRA
ncbi:MAG: hypothetical protein ABI673_04245 [Novosphingobium sp.]